MAQVMEIPKAPVRADPALKSAHFFPPREVARPHASGHRDRAAHTVNVKQAANVLELIEFFAAHRRPATLAEIAKHFDWPRSSTFNLLGTLLSRGYLYEPRARGGYYPAPIWASLIAQIEEAQPIPQALHQLLEQLVEATGETAVLAAVSGSHALFVDAIESPHAIRYAACRCTSLPPAAHCSRR